MVADVAAAAERVDEPLVPAGLGRERARRRGGIVERGDLVDAAVDHAASRCGRCSRRCGRRASSSARGRPAARSGRRAPRTRRRSSGSGSVPASVRSSRRPSAGPSPFCTVSQKNGCCCGPEKSGPLIGWLTTSKGRGAARRRALPVAVGASDDLVLARGRARRRARAASRRASSGSSRTHPRPFSSIRRCFRLAASSCRRISTSTSPPETYCGRVDSASIVGAALLAPPAPTGSRPAARIAAPAATRRTRRVREPDISPPSVVCVRPALGPPASTPHPAARRKWQERERPPRGGLSGLLLFGRSLFGLRRLVRRNGHLLGRGSPSTILMSTSDSPSSPVSSSFRSTTIVDAGVELAAEHEVGERILDEALDRAAQRPGAHRRVEALLDEHVLRRVGQLDRDLVASPSARAAASAAGRRS